MTWHNEPRRHSLAARGIKTSTKGKPFIKSYRGYATPQREEKIKILVEKINESALYPIKNKERAIELINERMDDEKLNNPVFDHLSTDKSSGKLFAEENIDSAEAVVFVDIDYATKRAGNITFADDTEQVKIVINKGILLDDIPFYSFKDSVIGEGNHRTRALKELGYKSVPVRLMSAWGD